MLYLTTFLIFLSFPFPFPFPSPFATGGFFLVIFFLSFSLSSTVCVFEEVVMYRIFEDIGEESEILSRGKVVN